MKDSNKAKPAPDRPVTLEDIGRMHLAVIAANRAEGVAMQARLDANSLLARTTDRYRAQCAARA